MWVGVRSGGRAGSPWLGTHQRDAGAALVGTRLYNPATGRFLSIDPVCGGNDAGTSVPPTRQTSLTSAEGRLGASEAGAGHCEDILTMCGIVSVIITVAVTAYDMPPGLGRPPTR